MYVEAYLSEHPLIDKSQPIVARHREHDGNGLSLQVIAFSSRVDLNTFENVQSEILEHLLAVMKEFDLKVFQAPTGEELVSLTGNK
jgi:miniconductance mechanosensitive channel